MSRVILDYFRGEQVKRAVFIDRDADGGRAAIAVPAAPRLRAN
jgi:hypothetical protein